MPRAKISFSPVEESERVRESTQITSRDVSNNRLVNYRGRLVSDVFSLIIISIEEF